MRFSLPSIKCSAASDYCRALFRCAPRFDYRSLGSGRKLGGSAEHLVDGSVKCMCRLSFEFLSVHVIESRAQSLLLTLGALVRPGVKF